MNDALFLVDDVKATVEKGSIKILVVDDEVSIHTITIGALKNKLFDDKKLEILTALSGAEAKQILNEHDDIHLALIDVVMETPEAGLELVEYIRDELKNEMIRLVLRTGQPSQAPEEHVINHYDINDYKEKTELTAQKLYTLVRTSIKQYQQYQALKDSRDVIYEKMTTSELTKLPNRMKLNESLDSEGRKSLILVNIDDFSTINETQGFTVGDSLLKDFASYLNNEFTKSMKIFHLHSDIFAILCFNVDTKEVETCMQDLKQKISGHVFCIDNLNLHLTVSLGIVLHEKGNLIQKAEFAIKEARNLGKNNAQIYTDDLNIIRTIHANSKWTQRLREAIKEDKIHAYFQAIKNYKTGEVQKYEALVRLEYDGEIYTPYHFIDAAFYSGFIYDIFKIMFKKTCQKAQGNTYEFSVNISEYDLKEESFFEYVQTTLKEHKIDAARISLEILEYKSVSNDEKIKKLINDLHDFGFKISIDDFGTQCSNFSQLNDLPIDFIKIDGSFIKDIVNNENSQIVSRTIIDFARHKKIPVIAEFVCDGDVYQYVKDIGADYAQGYFISEPQPELLK
ncbi:EAL domain-containing protein [Sulfurimonas sp. SAG-AH-194-C21]|nr:EAL domain-containing protein [Sulfurimonas sp. SAG-AH-194-C21]MDF1882994.1 EAL domain-containing protein [Sulfurimonas sp. SAG-AH-194-C21]